MDKEKIVLTILILVFIQTGLTLIGISVDKLTMKDCVFVLVGIGIGLLVNAKLLLNFIKKDE